MNSIITVDNLVKRYKKTKENAVDDVSFAVESGEFFTLLGPNGAGKTTTISILTTTLSKTSGTIEVAGCNLDTHPSEVRQQVGVIFQNHSLDLNLTAEENIRIHAVLYHLYPWRPVYAFMPKAYKDRLAELAAVLGVENDLGKPVQKLSGGMKRKLEIVRSLMHNPKVLFLDEPTAGLDPISRRNLWKYLREVRQKQHTTIFLTTHYLEEAEEADHVCIIDKGKIISLGTPSDIKEELVEEYLLLDALDRNALELELKRMNLSFSEELPFHVSLKNTKAQDVIRTIETPLSKLEIHHPTLEDAYLEIIKSNTDERG